MAKRWGFLSIPLVRQREITKIASRKLRYFTPWQCYQIYILRDALAKNQTLSERERCYMRDIETTLIYKGDLNMEGKRGNTDV